MPVRSSNLDYLIDALRLHLYDIDSDSYRYRNSWLLTALVASVKALMPWWNSKYTVDTSNDVERNSAWSSTDYEFDSPPIVQIKDERPIVLMASIIIKGGTLENNAWDYGSWRDDEIQYSNIEGAKQKSSSLQRDWDELTDLLTPPTKKLAQTFKRDLIN
jgi:hypothetical protein